MRTVVAIGCVLAALAGAVPAIAETCPGNPDALGTSRTLVIDPARHTRLGGFQYAESLPLNHKEVVITFDDGPLPPYSTRILETLAKECVKATYFMVGKMARAFPKVVRRTHAEGHTIASHSQNHVYTFHKMSVEQAATEIEAGFESLRVALGDSSSAVAPFFRFPGLLRQDAVENYLASRKMMAWSVDFMADDWTRIRASEVVRRALMRIDAKGKGILLLHDIQPATALGLPTLLRELKQRGYRIVHVVPAGPTRVATATTPEQWMVRRPHRPQKDDIWPGVIPVAGVLPEPVLEAPSVHSFGVGDHTGTVIPVSLVERPPALRGSDREIPLPARAPWPRIVANADTASPELLPAPSMENFRVLRLWKNRPVRRKARPSATRTKAAVARSKDATPSKKRVRSKVKRSKSKTRDASKPSGKQRSGHQIQLPKQQQKQQKQSNSAPATVWGRLTESVASLTR
ncbi:MAG: polysaccharide deacetylase family protein [Xanthobacteraceae bacterium]